MLKHLTPTVTHENKMQALRSSSLTNTFTTIRPKMRRQSSVEVTIVCFGHFSCSCFEPFGFGLLSPHHGKRCCAHALDFAVTCLICKRSLGRNLVTNDEHGCSDALKHEFKVLFDRRMRVKYLFTTKYLASSCSYRFKHSRAGFITRVKTLRKLHAERTTRNTGHPTLSLSRRDEK